MKLTTSKIIAGFVLFVLVLLLGTIIGLLWQAEYYPAPHLAGLALAALRASRWNRAAARVESGTLDSRTKSWAAIRAAIDKSALASIRLEEDPSNKEKLEALRLADKELAKALRLHR